MIRFILSFWAMWLAIYGWNCIADNDLLTNELSSYVNAMLLLCLIPTLASTSVAVLVHTLRPRRIFDAPAKYGLGPVLLGIVTGLLSLGLVAFFLVLMGDNANSSMIQLGSSAGATFIV